MRLQQIGIKLLTVLVAIIFAGTDSLSQSQYPSNLLEQKGIFLPVLQEPLDSPSMD